MKEQNQTLDSDSVESTVQIIVFGLHSDKSKKEDYGVNIEQVREIRFSENITTVPNAPPYVKGVMNLRGKIITVIDTKKKLGFSDVENNLKPRVLIVDLQGTIMGFLVDEVSQVMRISLNDIEQNPATTSESEQYVKGIAKTQGRLIVLLDLEKLLLEKNLQQTAREKNC